MSIFIYIGSFHGSLGMTFAVFLGCCCNMVYHIIYWNKTLIAFKRIRRFWVFCPLLLIGMMLIYFNINYIYNLLIIFILVIIYFKDLKLFYRTIYKNS